MDNFLTFLQSDAFTYLMYLIAIVFCRYLIPMAKIKYDNMKYNSKFDKISDAVAAAEKIYQATKMGPLKREFVYDYLKNTLKIDIDDPQTKVMLEAACKALDIIKDEYAKENPGPTPTPTESEEE